MEKLLSLSHRLSRSGDKRSRRTGTDRGARCASFGRPHGAALAPQQAPARCRGAATETPPPAYTPTASPSSPQTPPATASSSPPAYSAAADYTMDDMTQDGTATNDDPHYLLYLFDTVFLIDDSTSMLGPRWREVRSALRQITPVCTSHDDDGIDIHFMNHRSSSSGGFSSSFENASSQRVGGGGGSRAPGGYYNVTDPCAVDALFRGLRPCGPTHTRGRIEDILDPYFAQLERADDVRDVRPLNLIVITDGMPGPWSPPSSLPPRYHHHHHHYHGHQQYQQQYPYQHQQGEEDDEEDSVMHNPHLPGPAIARYARRLDALGAPAWQVGVQFVQVGDDAGATAALRGLDDGLAARHGVRDMVDTLKYGDDDYKTLTAGEILKVVLGAVNKRLDNVASGSDCGGRRSPLSFTSSSASPSSPASTRRRRGL
ncbi:hypothetical protein JDV02_006131 [Purpureocillium takamizusanense]|uniref:VWFA domain-containing protein n=1 Tax=Purpureocillium takamizusanense TaxID=2060973 RepID=A0A9Q8QIR5_9HYPO|nr:uncharacterized protein JDV02_006131 [Purpureocillium takamizusanense]UNI19992.1 hypothetical protein JDV02_006131 [Purpureocillium takamizusanense]